LMMRPEHSFHFVQAEDGIRDRNVTGVQTCALPIFPLGEVRFSESIHDLFSVSYKHRIHLPADLTLLAKTLLTIEGIVEQLDPELSIVKMAEPFGRELLKEKYHPKKVVGDLVDDFLEYKELISE